MDLQLRQRKTTLSRAVEVGNALPVPELVEGIRRKTRETPPGGGACYWCSVRLYRRSGLWSWAEIEELGQKRAVHLETCAGPGAWARFGIDLVLRNPEKGE